MSDVVRIGDASEDDWLELDELDLAAYALAKAVRSDWDVLDRKEKMMWLRAARVEASLARARARYDAMTPEEREAHDKAQRESISRHNISTGDPRLD